MGLVFEKVQNLQVFYKFWWSKKHHKAAAFGTEIPLIFFLRHKCHQPAWTHCHSPQCFKYKLFAAINIYPLDPLPTQDISLSYSKKKTYLKEKQTICYIIRAFKFIPSYDFTLNPLRDWFILWSIFYECDGIDFKEVSLIWFFFGDEQNETGNSYHQEKTSPHTHLSQQKN